MPGKSTLPVPFGASNKLPLVFVVAIVLASKLKLSVVTLPVPCGVSVMLPLVLVELITLALIAILPKLASLCVLSSTSILVPPSI